MVARGAGGQGLAAGVSGLRQIELARLELDDDRVISLPTAHERHYGGESTDKNEYADESDK
ncbi:MAG TPA: hypothetical protein VFH15_14155 [Pyrinomonadaceae bacterium]|nr:hypothetical protein [Pyrinomonadaceae bacterium]